MKINKKVKAFTLSEMIIVLMLTTIVVGLAFSVLRLVQSHMFSIKENFETQTEVQKLQESLSIDFNRYASVNYHPENKRLFFKNEIDSIAYQIEDEFIVRESDTFNLKVKEPRFFYRGSLIPNGKVDAFKCSILTGSQLTKDIFVYQKLDAADQMN